ncbi:MAG: hypothetical protein DRP45_03055 [Candidatus Zixiibacteriota bacterium]|nr:MAG: hypothetical protein DRP45_03055 [candidate division Zixibacteria bacterium]
MSPTDNLQAKIQQEITELTTSVSGLVESFRKLQNPLAESHRKVPQATNQLDKISEQTEAATSQMLDMIEQITQREDEIIKDLGVVKQKAESGETTEIGALADVLTVKATTNLNDAYAIMEALQFQDITAQQMDHAASLLEDIEGKLRHVLTNVSGDEAPEKLEEPAIQKKKRAYDPHADLFNKTTNQEDIDSLFQNPKQQPVE